MKDTDSGKETKLVLKDDIITDKLQEPLRALWDISLFGYALLFIFVFLASVLACLLLGFGVHFAFLPPVAIVVVKYIKDSKNADALKSVEKGNSSLRERLSAAYDNRDRENLVVKELVREVAYDLDDVRTDAFMDRGRTNAYIIASIIIVFILISLLFAGFEGFGGPGLFGGWGGTGSGGNEGQGTGGGSGGGGANEAGEEESSQETTIGAGPRQDIYGDSSIAQIEGQDLELEIHPEYGETSEFDNEVPEGGEAVQNIQAGFVQATAAESYTENIPVELEDSVREYFERLAEV